MENEPVQRGTVKQETLVESIESRRKAGTYAGQVVFAVHPSGKTMPLTEFAADAAARRKHLSPGSEDYWTRPLPEDA